MTKELNVERLNEFVRFLMGGQLPGGLVAARRPRKMSAEQAMTIIYVVQEFLGCIPDVFEMCSVCQLIFDTEQEGHISEEDKFYCSDCSYNCQCKHCVEVVSR